MNPFRVLEKGFFPTIEPGDLSHLTSILILIRNIKTTKYFEGISFKTQTLYALVFITRYLDLLTFHWVSLYNAFMKVFFIVSTAYIVVLLQGSKRTNTIAYNEMLMGDTFKIQHLLIGSALMSLFFHHKFTFLELAWSFSVWLESVAILPQLYMLSKGGKTRSLTVHYIFAMGLYRALYIPNWIWRNSTEDKKLDKIALFAGLLQTLLYSDFFYIYYTKVIKGKGFKLPK